MKIVGVLAVIVVLFTSACTNNRHSVVVVSGVVFAGRQEEIGKQSFGQYLSELS